ncbi:aminopeptidase P N-terminal domain-containing protein [Halorhodospira abdelmalekii]|uniref:aminopeptidase P N-terminal domain-containing protein n=1 Tax=Halorhodospira abdelmalekii TaxID=421629 RepID=UPI003083F5D8
MIETGAPPRLADLDARIAEAAVRRQRLAERLDPYTAVVLPAAREQPRNGDATFPFRQDSDFLYLTAFPEPEAVALFLPGRADGELVLFVRERDREQERWAGSRYGTRGAKQRFAAAEAYPLSELERRLPHLLVGRERLLAPLGRDRFWDERLIAWLHAARRVARGTARKPQQIELLDGTLHELRLHKEPAEIEAIQHAASVSALAHRQAMQSAAAGVPEYRIAGEMLGLFQRCGGEAAYPPIVASGANACTLHYVSNQRVLRNGDLLLIDAGAELNGYAADITRTFPVNGAFSGEQRAVYEIVLAAQRAALEQLDVGSPFTAFHDAATRVLVQGMIDLGWLHGEVDGLIEQGEQRRFYPHHTGHWLGMDVHDVGQAACAEQWRVLAPGMVLTVEPGLYCPPRSKGVDRRWHGIGVRIEDDVWMGDGGPQILTAEAPKGVAEIEAWMAADERSV